MNNLLAATRKVRCTLDAAWLAWLAGIAAFASPPSPRTPFHTARH